LFKNPRTLFLSKGLRYFAAVIATFVLLFGLGAGLAFYPVPATAPDTHTDDPAVKKIQANGLEFAYLEAGEGPLVLLLHGFPDNAHTWDEVLPRLAENGYHAVAVYNRGYFPTEIPADADYSVETLANDTLALIDALGYESATVVGQDWGASIAYAAANINPAKVSKLVTLAIPPQRTFKPRPRVFWRFPHFLHFQFGPLSEWFASRDNFAYPEYLLTYWSPSWDVPPAQVAQMKEDFARPGRLTAALRYYHFAFVDGFDSRKTELYQAVTTVPTLVLVGEEDGLMDVGGFDGVEDAFSGPFEFVVVPNAGHFLHREQPEIFAETLLAFLNRP
jgi:pimeloyl-ACP methyl ester carboxylesterase